MTASTMKNSLSLIKEEMEHCLKVRILNTVLLLTFSVGQAYTVCHNPTLIMPITQVTLKVFEGHFKDIL